MGIGATLTFDIWGLFLKIAFGITPSNFCLVGRWLRYMPEGRFKHINITSSPSKSAECIVGWIAHYIFGITFAIVFVLLFGVNWLQNPTIIPAIIYGIATVFASFCIMQPSFGFGIAASKNIKSNSGKNTNFNESYCIWYRALPFCIIGKFN